METLGKKLKELRTERKLTQKEVSFSIGLTKNAIANYEADIREPSLDVLKKLCDFFEVSADYLIGRSDSY